MTWSIVARSRSGHSDRAIPHTACATTAAPTGVRITCRLPRGAFYVFPNVADTPVSAPSAPISVGVRTRISAPRGNAPPFSFVLVPGPIAAA